MAGSLLSHLACAAGDDVLVALPATLCVVGGAESILNILNLLEDFSVGIKRCLVNESVGDVIKTRGRLSSTTGDCRTALPAGGRGLMKILHALLKFGTRLALGDQG